MPFPNRETQIGASRGPTPGRKPGILIGRKRKQALRKAAATIEAIKGSSPQFNGLSLDLFRQVYQDTTLPIEMRLAAARCAAPYEHPTLQSAPAVGGGSAKYAEQLQAARIRAMPREQLDARIRELHAKLAASGFVFSHPSEPLPALPAPQPEPGPTPEPTRPTTQMDELGLALADAREIERRAMQLGILQLVNETRAHVRRICELIDNQRGLPPDAAPPEVDNLVAWPTRVEQ